MGAYSRWALIWSWALIRINTVVRVWNGGSFAVTTIPQPELLSSLSSRVPFSFPTPHPERRFWAVPLTELWSNPVSLQEILRFPESRTNPRSQENPSRSWMISEMVSLHLRWTPFLASWHHFFFLPVIDLDTELCRIETWKSWKGLIVRLEISRNIKFEVMGGVPATKYTLINHWAGRLKIIENWLHRQKSYIAYILCSFPTIRNRISWFSS